MENTYCRSTALDFETTAVPFFNSKGKNKLDSMGHPRFAVISFFSASNGADSWLGDPKTDPLPKLPGIVVHNLSFDGLVGIQNGHWSLRDLWTNKPNCTALMAKVLKNSRLAGLKDLAVTILGEADITRYHEVDKDNSDQFQKYAIKDAEYTARLFPIFENELKAECQWELYREVELPFALVNLECEINGVQIDRDALTRMIVHCRKQITALGNEITTESINFNSPKQLKQFVFGTLNQPLTYLKGKVSTSRKALQTSPHPKVKALVKQKLLTGQLRQLENISRFIDPSTNRIYPYINTLGADTGRCTSSCPNLQNISKESVMREMFAAQAGYRLVVLDFSQIEPRVLAHFLGKGGFRSLFDRTEDFYTVLAREVFSSGVLDIPARIIAKQAVLGVMYGLGPKTMAENLGCTTAQAREYLERFYSHYPEILEFKNTQLERARSCG